MFVFLPCHKWCLNLVKEFFIYFKLHLSFLPGKHVRIVSPGKGLFELLELERGECGAIPPLFAPMGRRVAVVDVQAAASGHA